MSRTVPIRPGDRVLVMRPEVLVRCGYPNTVSDYYAEARKLLGDIIRPFPEHASRKAIHAIAYGLALGDGFGGRDRTLHLSSRQDLACKEGNVLAVRFVKTGRYSPPQHWENRWTGESEWKPGGLENEKTHRIATVEFPGIWEEEEIPAAHLEKVTANQLTTSDD